MSGADPLSGRRWWLVGASEGLGRALAHELSAAGAHLVLSARNEGRLRDLAAALPGPAQVVAMDVADAASVAAGAAAAGPVDGLAWLAAAYWPIPATAWDGARVAQMLDVNLTGAARVLGAVVPGMVARGRGHIVLTGSLSGYRGLPGAIGYAASKAGLMVLAEGMHADLRGSGVRVQLVIPGFIRTRLTARNDFAMPFIMAPEAAARRVLAHIRSRRFARSFPAPFAWLFRLGNFLPDGLYYRLFR